METAGQMERLLPQIAKSRRGFFKSFKNRILISTLLVLVVAVICIGVMLQAFVFPKLRGDDTAILSIKMIHFIASLVIIGLSWMFIERISKKIALPLMELTRRADQISREAGAGLSDTHPDAGENGDEDLDRGDEIVQLTRSFNRMLFHLKAAEDRLRESETKYRFLFDSGPSPIFLVDADSMSIIDVNARAEEEYQYAKNELLAMTFADLGRDQDRAETSARLRNLFATEVTLLPVLQHKRKDGTPFMVNFQASVTSYRDRPAVIAAVWDVTERLRKYTQLIQAGKMATLGEMATGIAHELNQPLSVIKIGCDYLNKKSAKSDCLTFEDVTAATVEICGSVDRATKIIDHLRQFGRRTDQKMIPVSVNQPVRDVFTLLGRQMQNGGVTCVLELDDSLPMIMADANRLEQVFINLVLNARDAMTKPVRNGSLDLQEKIKILGIRSFLEGNRVVVTVSDTGSGIPEEIKSKVFEPFFTTKDVGEGTGLGLSISYSIVKEHQGTIELDDSYTQGACFRITFPVAAEE
ncbi:MAG: ATP-binding protein [Thermodesulfobacteriota bacterium]